MRRTDSTRSTLIHVLGIGAVVLSVGCDSGTPVAARSAVGPAPQGAEADSAEPPDLILHSPGQMSFEFSGGRIALVANRVPARQILDRLVASLRFELEIGRGVILPRAVTVRLSDVGVDAALEQVLAGLPYSVDYSVDPDDTSRVLSRVRVGEPEMGEFEVACVEPKVRMDFLRRKIRRRIPEITPVDRQERYQRNQDAWFDDLANPDPTARAYAVEALYLDERTFPILTDLLSNDPDPRVRAAAAGTLADDLDNPSAADALIPALNDQNSEVVIEALDALEDVGDASNIADVQPLLFHPDSDVREEAINAIEWLAD
jgi:hypothetical protein